jgi:hypothetical protein
MNVRKFLVAAVGVGVVMNVFDFVVNGIILQNAVYAKLPLLKQNLPITWLVVADFVAALVFVWVYVRVSGSFGASVQGGVQYGFYAGVLINFPTWIVSYLLINGFTYSLAWTWTVMGIIWCLIAGAVAGALYKK